MGKALDTVLLEVLPQPQAYATGAEARAEWIRLVRYADGMHVEAAHVEEDPAREDFGLLCRLVKLGQTDRERYRKFRALMWALYVENSGRSDKPSESS